MKKLLKLTPREILIITILVLLYFASRLYALDVFPIFVDEAIYARWSQIALHDASWRFISLTDGKQPLFMWLAMPLIGLIENPLVATRLVSVFSGFLTLIGVIVTGKLLKNSELGIYAAAFVVLSPFLFFYDRFAVVESLLTASGIWIFNLGILLARYPRLDIAMITGIAAGLALLVKSPAQIYLLLLPVQFILLASKLTKKSWLRLILLYLIVCVFALAIYNIQRLSPWMHMITAKNSEFVISPIEMLTTKPFRIVQNLADSLRWLVDYLTIPIIVLALASFAKIKQYPRELALVTIWLVAPIFALSSTALIYRPRYLVFIAPYLLLLAAYGFVNLKKMKWIFLILIIFLQAKGQYYAYFDPHNYPLHRADYDYVSGWASGNGVKEIADYLKSRAVDGKRILVGTEGTFGLLPHGLELYTHGTPNLTITGFYPLKSIPPLELVEQTHEYDEVYFLLNNTQISTDPDKTELVLSYQKADPSWIKLLRLSQND